MDDALAQIQALPAIRGEIVRIRLEFKRDCCMIASILIPARLKMVVTSASTPVWSSAFKKWMMLLHKFKHYLQFVAKS
jgi:hypothetical protein